MIYVTDSHGRPIAEPVSRSVHDDETDECSHCNYCGQEIALTDEPDWCSEACREADEEAQAEDARADMEDES